MQTVISFLHKKLIHRVSAWDSYWQQNQEEVTKKLP